MIERLLAAEAALEAGDLEVAGRLYRQVADADPRNAIAVVGLARVALLEGRLEEAAALVDRALEIDPAEAAARRMLVEIGKTGTGARDGATAGGAAAPARAPAPAAAEVAAPGTEPSTTPATEPAWPEPAREPWVPGARRPRAGGPSLLQRILRMLGLRRGS
jgi:tetratricopeptide (TPR) repeat protein